jgi:GNAT superfamily N-acetyltransferase
MNEYDAFTIRSARLEDTPLILQFIRDLAEYEKLLHEVRATEESLRECLFGPRPVAEALIGEFEGQPAGFALFFHNFSTFVGRPGIYIEDIFVRSEFRGRGLGTAFFLYLAELARRRDCGRIEWAVLDWNEPAIEFYRRLGARPMDQWRVFRLDREMIGRLAAGGGKEPDIGS